MRRLLAVSLEEPGLDTISGGPDSRSGDHHSGRPDSDETSVGDAAPSRTRHTPEELIALAEQEEADRRRGSDTTVADGAAPRRREQGSTTRPDKDEGKSKKRRARKVRRIVRRFDAWSVLKFSLLFYLCCYLIAMVAGVLLWNAAQRAGTIEGFEGFITDLGAYKSFTFEGDQIFNGFLVGGLVLVVASAAGTVLLAVLFNLISDLTGGIRVTVIEEESAAPLRKPAQRPEPRPKGPRSISELSQQ